MRGVYILNRTLIRLLASCSPCCCCCFIIAAKSLGSVSKNPAEKNWVSLCTKKFMGAFHVLCLVCYSFFLLALKDNDCYFLPFYNYVVVIGAFMVATCTLPGRAQMERPAPMGRSAVADRGTPSTRPMEDARLIGDQPEIPLGIGFRGARLFRIAVT